MELKSAWTTKGSKDSAIHAGPHIKKYCKNERMSLEELAEKFRLKHPNTT